MNTNEEMERDEALLLSASFVLGILLAGFVYWKTGEAQRVWIILESIVATQIIFHVARTALKKDRDKKANGMTESNSTKE